MRCIADAGGAGVQLFRKSEVGVLRDFCVKRLGNDATAVGESVVLGKSPFPADVAAGSSRASQQEAARAVLQWIPSVRAARPTTDDEDLWYGSIISTCPAQAVDKLQPAGRKRKPLALQIIDPTSLCPDLDAARLRGEEAGTVPEPPEERPDDDGPGDCWCGLDDDQQDEVISARDHEAEELHQLIERNRSAALARRKARQEKALQAALASAVVMVSEEGGVVSHSRIVTLPGFGAR